MTSINHRNLSRLAQTGLVAISLALTVGGCSTPRALEGETSVTVVDSSELPPPSRSDMTMLDRSYLIGPYDKWQLTVFGIEELTDLKVQVDGGGRITFPMIGELEAAGKTPSELARYIEGGLQGRYIRDPQVSVNLEELVSQVVTVDGEVDEPGQYPVLGKMTLMKAVASAKGTTEFARQDDVVIYRSVEGTQMAALYNLGAVRKGIYPDPEIYPNDVVVVGNSRARRVFRDILSAAPLLTTPIIAIVSNRNGN